MKLMASIIISVVIFFATALLVETTTHIRGDTEIVLCGVVAAIVFAYMLIFRGKHSTDAIADTLTTIKSTRDSISSRMEDADPFLYAVAEKEINDGEINEGLWSQALVKAKGDESLRKVEYMKLRVRELKKDSTKHA